MSIELYGMYEKTLFRDEKTALTLFALKVPETIKERNSYGTVVVSAHIPYYHKNTPLKIVGEWERTEKGLKLIAESVKEEAQDKLEAILYLSSGLVSGIGQQTARAIVNRFGKDIFTSLREESSIDELVSMGLPHDKATMLVSQVRGSTVQRELFEFILKYGGFYQTAKRLYRAFGINAIKTLRENPYVGIWYGLDFEQCDQIGRDYRHHAASAERIRAACIQALRKDYTRGHIYTEQHKIMKDAENALNKGDFVYKVPSCIISSVGINANSDISVEEGEFGTPSRVFIRNIREAEIQTALEIERLLANGEDLKYSDDLCSWVESEIGIEYAPQQKATFDLLRRSGVCIVTGGPGTGKTTTVNGLIKAYKKMYPENTVKLCAPTGRAAQRMTESTGEESVTIHRLLEYRPFGSEVMHKNQLDPIDADFIVVDEASMLDLELAALFLGAVKNGTLVLFVGDVNQLPSVRAGDVLHDMIGSGVIPTCQLTTVYRQAAESPIVGNAQRINEGNTEFILKEGFSVEYLPDAEKIGEEIISLVKERWDKKDPFKVQVLCPTHKGAAGVSALNAKLQALLNPVKEGERVFKFGSKTYRKGDKVILNNNNYSYGYFNGDIGIITDVVEDGLKVKILDKELLIDRDVMDDLNLAYAMTIHKSQGSEFENVIVSLPFKPITMLKRNLLYTAVTRAKQNVYIVAENGAIHKAVKTVETGTRNTRLKERLTEAIS